MKFPFQKCVKQVHTSRKSWRKPCLDFPQCLRKSHFHSDSRSTDFTCNRTPSFYDQVYISLWSYTFPKMNWVSLCLKSVFELWKKLASKVVKLCRVPTGKAVSHLLANHKAQRGGFPILFAIWAKQLCPSGSGMIQAATGDINSALLFSVYPFTAVPLAFFLFFFSIFSFFSFLFC